MTSYGFIYHLESNVGSWNNVNCTFEKQARVFSKVHLWNFKNYILSVLLRCDQEAFPLKSSHKLATWKGNSLHCFLADYQPMIMISSPLFRPASVHDKFNFFKKDYFKWNHLLLYCRNPSALPLNCLDGIWETSILEWLLLPEEINFRPLKTSCATLSLQLE